MIVALLFSTTQVVLADRGIGKRNKNKAILNISIPTTLRSSIALNIKSGLLYKGSLLSSNENTGNSSFMNSSIVTYQKGNTVYILPYKHRVAMPEMRQGYSGLKFTIQPH